MKIIKTNKEPVGFPDFYSIYLSWLHRADESGSNKDYQEANRFARLAEEFGLATIEDDDTIEF